MKPILIAFLFVGCTKKSIDYKELIELRKANKYLAQQLIEYSKLNQEYINETSLKLAQKDTVISYLRHRKRYDRRMEVSANHKSN